MTVRERACARVPTLTLCYVPEVLLTNASVDLSLTDKDGNTALHLACSSVSGHLYYFNNLLEIHDLSWTELKE